MSKNTYIIVLVVALAAAFTACVPVKKYRTAEAGLKQCLDEKAKLENQLAASQDKVTEAEGMLRKIVVEMKQLRNDTASLRNELRTTKSELRDLRAQFEAFQITARTNATGAEKEMRQMLSDLQKQKEMQILKEDELKRLSKALEEKEKNLDDLTAKLKQKEARVNELEKIMSTKDSVVIALRKKVTEALTGFVGKGLSIQMKNGKIYVSLEENLLFATASWQVSAQGTEALKKLAKVLVDNPDINIMVEGHTDNVPYTGSGQVKDNWDLSVMRANAVTKIILGGSTVNPARIISAGRSEYVPLQPGDSREVRARNRRTEIILTPKLDELFRIIEAN